MFNQTHSQALFHVYRKEHTEGGGNKNRDENSEQRDTVSVMTTEAEKGQLLPFWLSSQWKSAVEVRKTRNGSLKISLAPRYYFFLHIQRKQQSLGSRALFILCTLGVSSSCGRVRHYNLNYGHAVARVSALQVRRRVIASPAPPSSHQRFWVRMNWAGAHPPVMFSYVYYTKEGYAAFPAI